jgi:3-oxoacid CoA-transferase subunit A
VVSNNCGVDDWGLGMLLGNKQIRKMTSSATSARTRSSSGSTSPGELEVELVPQGTLAERLRAGGAGIPASTPPRGGHAGGATGGCRCATTGRRREASEKKETRPFDGRDYVLERAITGDFAIVKAWKGDRHGNLVFRKTSRNFNPLMATAARVTIAEVEELVESGALDPDQIHTPGIYVQRIFRGRATRSASSATRTVRKRRMRC